MCGLSKLDKHVMKQIWICAIPGACTKLVKTQAFPCTFCTVHFKIKRWFDRSL